MLHLNINRLPCGCFIVLCTWSHCYRCLAEIDFILHASLCLLRCREPVLSFLVGRLATYNVDSVLLIAGNSVCL